MAPDDWRRYRLTRGTYGQRQDGVQMLRVKAPQGIVSSGQMRAFATVASKYSRGFGHVTTRQNIQLHFVLLKDCEDAMRDPGRRRADHARGVRQRRAQRDRLPLHGHVARARSSTSIPTPRR